MPKVRLVLVALAVPVMAITLNVHLLASGAFLRWEFGRPGFPAVPGIADVERLALAVPSTLFIVRPMPAADLAALRHDGQPLYTAAEIGHLEDVRRVVARVTTLGLLGGLLVVAALALAWRRGRWAEVGRSLRWGGWLTVGLVVAVGLGMALAWPLLFTGFHRVFFPAGTWQFDYDSGLIRLFPDQFWYDTALALAALSAAEGLLAVLVGRWLARREPAEAIAP